MKTTILAQIAREIKRLRSGYRPERHYMRGPRRVDSTPQQLKAREVQTKEASAKLPSIIRPRQTQVTNTP